MQSRHSQGGLSMVELMVALALSSFLILGVTQIYIDNKRSYAFQQNQAENLESSRYALILLQQELAKAGYRREPDQTMEDAFRSFPDLADCGAFAAGEAVRRTAQDSLCIRYKPRDPIDRDCLGGLPVTATALAVGPYTEPGEVIIERLWFEKEKDGSQTGTFKCTTVHTDLNGTETRAAATGDLIAGVVDLRYELGVGSATDTRSIGQYTTGSPTPTTPILAVRYTLLLRSSMRLRESVDADTALTQWKNLVGLASDDSRLAALKADDGGQLYQVSQSSVMLRNLMP